MITTMFFVIWGALSYLAINFFTGLDPDFQKDPVGTAALGMFVAMFATFFIAWIFDSLFPE